MKTERKTKRVAEGITARWANITMLRAAGVDDKTVAQLAGHADSGFTARRYGEVQPHHIEHAAQALQKMIGGGRG